GGAGRGGGGPGGGGGVFAVEGVGEDQGVVGADGAAHAGVGQAAQGMFGKRRGDGEADIAERADVEGDVAVDGEGDDVGVLDGAHAVLDAGDAELFDGLAHAVRSVEFAGVALGDFAGVAHARPDRSGPGFGGRGFMAVEIDPGEFVPVGELVDDGLHGDRKSTRLNSSHVKISYAVFCLKKKKNHR